MALILICLGCKSTPPPKPLSTLTPTEQSGHAVFATRCVACHNDRIDKPLNGPSLVGIYKKPYLPSGAPANDDRILNTIQHGRNNMPAMGNTMSEEETSDLLAYLKTL